MTFSPLEHSIIGPAALWIIMVVLPKGVVSPPPPRVSPPGAVGVAGVGESQRGGGGVATGLVKRALLTEGPQSSKVITQKRKGGREDKHPGMF